MYVHVCINGDDNSEKPQSERGETLTPGKKCKKDKVKTLLVSVPHLKGIYGLITPYTFATPRHIKPSPNNTEW